MFDSLADRIREDTHKEENTSERITRWVVIAVISAGIFGVIYVGYRLLA